MDYKQIFTMRRLWAMFGILMTVMFAALLAVGGRVYQQAPPIPEEVRAGGDVVFSAKGIHRGRDVWRQLGGMQLGSVWGHGAYLAPDWTADFLHREALAILSARAGGDFESLDEIAQAPLVAVLAREIRRNGYDAKTGVLTISEERARAIQTVTRHYINLFAGESEKDEALRKQYAIPNAPGGGMSAEDIRAMSAFFWWTAWAAATNRPGDDVTYTNNWPHEPLVGNRPTASTFLWSIISVVLLIGAVFGVYGLLGIGLMLFCLRGLAKKTAKWSDGILQWVFWLFNGGLALMVFGSILPQGFLQGYESFARSYWHARTAEFMHSQWMEALVWARVPGDIIFAIAALLLILFVLKTELAPRK